MITLKEEPERGLQKTEYLTYLVHDYGVSSERLLCATGSMMQESEVVIR